MTGTHNGLADVLLTTSSNLDCWHPLLGCGFQGVDLSQPSYTRGLHCLPVIRSSISCPLTSTLYVNHHWQSHCMSTITGSLTVCQPSLAVSLYVNHHWQSHCMSTITGSLTVCQPSLAVSLYVNHHWQSHCMSGSLTVCQPSLAVSLYVRQSHCMSTITGSLTVCQAVSLYVNHHWQSHCMSGSLTVCQPSLAVSLYVNHHWQSHAELFPPSLLTLATGQTLRWGTSQFGRAVGNFFGVTESSQHGTADTVGWEQVSEIRAEVRGCGGGLGGGVAVGWEGVWSL